MVYPLSLQAHSLRKGDEHPAYTPRGVWHPFTFTCGKQEAQLSPSDRAMRLVSSNLANYHATVQKLLIRQVLTKPMV